VHDIFIFYILYITSIHRVRVAAHVVFSIILWERRTVGEKCAKMYEAIRTVVIG